MQAKDKARAGAGATSNSRNANSRICRFISGLCICFIGLSWLLAGCQAASRKPGPHKNVEKDAGANTDSLRTINLHPDVHALTADFMAFWNYWYDSIDLTRDFLPLSSTGDTINKLLFLKQLHTGRYMAAITRIERTPSEAEKDQGLYTYQLLDLPASHDPGISRQIVQLTQQALHDYKREGQPLPAFDLTTIDGKHYTAENCKGRILVMDTWFVRCGACVAEMPDLNKWVYQYRDNKDLLFISLCLDDKAAIKKFLQKQGFAFEIAADAADYIEQKLDIHQYPTKILVDKQGKIVKIGSFASLRRELDHLIRSCSDT